MKDLFLLNRLIHVGNDFSIIAVSFLAIALRALKPIALILI